MFLDVQSVNTDRSNNAQTAPYDHPTTFLLNTLATVDCVTISFETQSLSDQNPFPFLMILMSTIES